MSANDQLLTLYSGQAIPLAEVPLLALDDFRHALLGIPAHGQRLAALFGDAPATEFDGAARRSTAPKGTGGPVDLYAVIAHGSRSVLRVAKTRLEADRFPSLTPDLPQAHLFEREIAEQYGIRPEGHPWFKPLRFHASYRPGHDAWGRQPGESPVCGVTDFYRVEGDEIHEVAVGPVHAGVIEPGHFRFQCHGEQVLRLRDGRQLDRRVNRRGWVLAGPGGDRLRCDVNRFCQH